MASQELHQPEGSQAVALHLVAEEKFLVVRRLVWNAWISCIGEPTNFGKSPLPTERLLYKSTDMTSLVQRYF